VADETEEQPEGQAAGEQAAEASSRETAVGHPVVESDSAATTPASGSGSEGATEVFFSRDEPQPASAPPVDSGGTSPAAADRQAADATETFDEKPELFVAGAFVGAFVFAKLLKKLTGSDD
jgi:hypothetical protein